jgi:hypothetical protein
MQGKAIVALLVLNGCACHVLEVDTYHQTSYFRLQNLELFVVVNLILPLDDSLASLSVHLYPRDLVVHSYSYFCVLTILSVSQCMCHRHIIEFLLFVFFITTSLSETVKSGIMRRIAFAS